ncbi:GNAT family N-acetyltransferase [Nocardia sp. GCM10030253]|uniref:GNAT family N-acetyltransferase n=1 Tax=Nocardia sp. GCM10030253 TaxID=3273404 RepID=UPI00363EC6C3
MIIRARTTADLPACVAALRAVHEADGYPAVWPHDPAHWLTPSKLIEAHVADIDGTVTGHVGIGAGAVPTAVRNALPGNDFASVIRLFVSPVGRGHGVGRRLLDAAVTMAETRGLRAVLDVEAGAAAAIALYERGGWKCVHSGPGDWITFDGREALLRYYVSP